MLKLVVPSVVTPLTSFLRDRRRAGVTGGMTAPILAIRHKLTGQVLLFDPLQGVLAVSLGLS